ncbi:Tyrosyl-DNA phosphodiesterase [Akanthomyces lecanii RCEF 1005]|uniref:Tyrosyl-DNA phosphodiesterase n=1 Tax=Akanthomyces lecanii RCEF 1005 TaxID=1081108 RepID=A0A168CXA1_CORDF|nr:Tyrosyl-DNA phosphodiesterase [Akanthomyces lecanii RCEF 1005]
MKGKEVIVLDSDSDEGEDMRRAIELSLQDPSMMNEEAAPTAKNTESSAAVDHTTFGGISLNRKEMEEARLNRLGKRRRNSNESGAGEPAMKRSTPQQSERGGGLRARYPQGTVRRTWAQGYTKTSDDITIEEIFQKEHLQLALLSSFQWDEEWLLSKLNVSKTRILLVAFAAGEEQKQIMRDNVPKNIRFCFPPMHGAGSMHSKLQLLKYPNYLRLVIPTGNLVPYDWGETGVMENMVFIIDLPRLEANGARGTTVFAEDVANFLKASGVEDAMVKSLGNYDFSATENLGFVCSIPGGHTGDALRRVGYCGLGATVRGLGLATDTPIEVDLACASLGSIKYDLINAMYNACQGDEGMREYNARVGRKPNNKEIQPTEKLRDRFRIYFPTDQTVAKICWDNLRPGKVVEIIFVRRPAGAELIGQSTYGGWAYIGSANLSESAWGRVVKDRGTGNAKMSCRNWECGVVVPVQGSPGNDGGFTMFSGTVPVPMEIPGRPYEKTDEPWFFDDQ